MSALISNPPPLISHLCRPNPHSSFASPLICRRLRFQIRASSLELPLLPFPIDQVLIPSEVKSLHLYEARYIALLEESLFQKNKSFVHFVLDPIGLGGTSTEASFAARYGRKIRYRSIGFDKRCRSSKTVGVPKALNKFTMVRSKIKYQLIADARTRRETFKKRKSGLLKKLNELKTLCNVEACGFVMNEDGSQSQVWPSMPAASQVVQRFLSLPSSSKTTNMVDQSGFLRQNLSRISKNLDRETRKVQHLEKELRLVECLAKEQVDISNSKELYEMLRLLDRKIDLVDRKIADVGPSSSVKAARARGIKPDLHLGKGKQPI
ncbi:agamous-like MADS-box protein AGL80 isoform X1 [Salvia splendens]|uniref:agamous-like MADS-box protein AGL80 isoform X1 n=1 Tax=Salvia splendens TaxID=180675 RepID=UPI001C26B505|nr:agamous-like MADS-box protein AGL80 isoform X1 [Salvia splendens]XP_042036195.1 agamous-like MADS-box protein AGL80 isoform X1 [Salvia splendens]XP_042036196.1 agamous-like MADS-box protein AGL80 isoform X1 [Salvia splendens]XP_042036197.1 agamous-like MADS-box protein AGL80 isoform X1 [Salvia splendens]